MARRERMQNRNIRSNLWLLIISAGVFLNLFFIPVLTSAGTFAPAIEVKDMQQWSSKGYTRVVIELSGPAEFLQKRLSNPDRLYFDLKNCNISKEINTTLPVGDGILKQVRVSQFNKDTVRVVLDLDDMKDFKAFRIDEPAQLIIDVYGNKKIIRSAEAAPAFTKIVLDPGHGGHDSGAIGLKGLKEKDVVLDIGLKLKKFLSKRKNIKVFMTRETDVFIPLPQRTAFANSKNADLFISIHANANPNRKARGIETYLLNPTNEEESLRVAARENAISIKKMKEAQTELGMILTSLQTQNKVEESINLANYVQRSIITVLAEKYSNVDDHGVKSAVFYVLVGAQMPSVLVETSFISNPIEERLFKKEAYREYIAEAIARGIDTYIASIPREQKTVVATRDRAELR